MKTTHRLSISPATPRTIGRLLLAGAICWSGAPLFAQNQPPAAPAPQSQPGSQALLTQDDLKEMVGPIALYPDALIALILPASTVPSDVVLGARFVDSKGDPSQAGNQPWDESVKSLVYYPDVLSWMNENLEWTASLGEAFMDQPADVMNAIQSLRATARASGALADTPQQRVVVQQEAQQETIRIIPADPEVIYVPQYDPEVVFVNDYSPGYSPFITFGVGFAVGSWLNYDCDWGRRYVYRGDWNRGGWDRGRWDGGRDVSINNTNINNTNVNVVNINSNNAVRWNPSNRSTRQLAQRQRNGGGNARFTTAEARAAREMIRTERRQNNGRLSANALAAARRDALPTPAKLQLREAANNRNAVRPQDRTNRNDTAETLAEARRNRDNATPNRPVAENRRKTPTDAPRVNGQLEAARQARREENRRDAAEDRQNVRQQAENRQVERPNQLPTRAPRVEDSDMPSQRPSVSERQRENRQSIQDNRQERQENRQQRQEARQERPAQRQEVRQPQPQRQEARPQQQQRRQEQRSERPAQRERAERPQQQRQEVRQQRQERQERPQRQEARQQRQENRQANRPQRQEQRQEKKSDDKGDRKKKD